MKFARRVLIAGGIFNTVMGLFFFSNELLEIFFRLAIYLESTVFRHAAMLPMPQNPAHLLLIHGFGAGALILGAMLIYSARDPQRYLPFICIDGLGRLLYGSLMVIYVFKYSLLWLMLSLAGIELFFAFAYIILSWRMAEP
jgi:hypothetical protein